MMEINFKTNSFKKEIKDTIKASKHVNFKSKNSYAIVNFNHPTSIPRDENVDKHISNLINEVFTNDLISNNFQVNEIEEDILLILNNLIAKDYDNMSKEDSDSNLIIEIEKFESKINKCINEEFDYYETILHISNLTLETRITIGNVEFFTLEKLTKQMLKINKDNMMDGFFRIGETYAKTKIYGLKKYAQDRAQIEIKIALNMLKLIMNEGYDFNLDSDKNISRNMQYLTISGNSNYFTTIKLIGFSYPCELTYDQLVESRYLFGFLSSILKIELNNEFEERLITAIYWFSEALSIKREKYEIIGINNNVESLGFFNKKHKLLNLVTCLETLLVFNSDDNIADKISKAIPILIPNYEYENEMKKFIKDIYQYRSKIVHRGIIRVTDEDLDKLTCYTRLCIFKLIDLYVFYQDKINFINSKY